MTKGSLENIFFTYRTYQKQNGQGETVFVNGWRKGSGKLGKETNISKNYKG